MLLTRQEFPSRIADLGFSIDLPEGFITPELPAEQPDFSNPVTCAPLAIMASQVAAAVVSVAARPAYENGTVSDWVRYLAQHFTLTTTRFYPGHVGGPRFRHPAILAEGYQQQEDGTQVPFRLAGLEDGGRLVLVQAMCPAELWPSYGAALEASVASLELATPRGPRAELYPTGGVPALERLDGGEE